MATILESYWNIKVNMDSGMKTAKPGPEAIWQYQELLYRIEVLQVCQMFQKSAPESTDIKVLTPHYHMLSAYIKNLTLERRGGFCNDQESLKQRETAHSSLMRVVDDFTNRFRSFAHSSDANRYGKEIASVIQTVLPSWIQYRETCITIKREVA